MDAERDGIRLDRWLWQARFFKTRGLATKFVSGKGVRINARRVSKPAATLRVGDGLSFALHGEVRVLRVLALGDRRGPASEARGLYADLDADADADAPPAAAAPLEPARQAVKQRGRSVTGFADQQTDRGRQP